MSDPAFQDDKAAATEHVEVDDHKGPLTTETLLVSKYAHLPARELARMFWKPILFSFGILFGALFDGFAVTMPGSISANASFIAYFGTVHTKGKTSLNAQYVSAWGGMSSGMQVVGMFCGGAISDRFGRKICLWIVCVFLVVAMVLELCSKNWIYFLCARGVAGWATGIAKATLTCFVAEIAPTGLRGTLLSGYALMYAIGQFSCAIALEIIQLKGFYWRNAFFSELVFLGLFVPCLAFAPESPWFYANKYDHVRAKQQLLRLNSCCPDYDVEHEYAVIAQEVEHTAALAAKSAAASWGELFRGINGRRTWISFLPLTTQQLVGSPLVFSYLSYFFSVAGLKNTFLVTVADNAILIVGLISAGLVIERVGRRPLLLISCSICVITSIFMGVIGTFGIRQGGTLTDKQGDGIVVLACLWVAAYSVGPAPLGYTLVAETSTPVLRAKTTAFATAACGGFALVFTYCTPLLISVQDANLGMEVAYVYAGLGAIGVVLIYLTVPETKGRSFAELDELFERRIPARRFASTKTLEQEQVEQAIPAAGA